MKKITIHCLPVFCALLFATACHHNATPDEHKNAIQQGLEKQDTKKWSLPDAVKAAEAAFEKYLPKILESHDAGIDVQQSFTGDFTGDGLEDVAIYFSLTPGGNAISSVGIALYKNTGSGVQVIAGFEPDYLFDFVGIDNGKIQIEKVAYAPEDGHCCPSIKTPQALTVNGKTIICTDIK